MGFVGRRARLGRLVGPDWLLRLVRASWTGVLADRGLFAWDWCNSVRMHGETIGEGEGDYQAIAERRACAAALEYLGGNGEGPGWGICSCPRKKGWQVDAF